MNAMRVRLPAVAGLFYPDTAVALRGAVETLLAGANAAHGPQPRALIVPHAGYIYSGAAAAAAYARLTPWRDTIRKVLVLGPPHRVAVRGLATSSATAFATPLGEVALDSSAQSLGQAAREVSVNDDAHAPEHAIEVQLPFIQTVLGDVALTPVLVAEPCAARVAELLAPYWQRVDTLIIVSTDLSHFLDDDSARRVDGATDKAIMALDAMRIGPQQACGCHALNGLLHLATAANARIERLALCNSADTAGDRARVVGYGAYVLH